MITRYPDCIATVFFFFLSSVLLGPVGWLARGFSLNMTPQNKTLSTCNMHWAAFFLDDGISVSQPSCFPLGAKARHCHYRKDRKKNRNGFGG